PFVRRLADLGVELVYAFNPKSGREGTVVVGPGFYGGRGWNGQAINTWLSDFLRIGKGASKLRKLGRTVNAAERHLVIVLDPVSEAGMGISLALSDLDEPGAAEDATPTLAPPIVTHLWLLPVMGSAGAL